MDVYFWGQGESTYRFVSINILEIFYIIKDSDKRIKICSPRYLISVDILYYGYDLNLSIDDLHSNSYDFNSSKFTLIV